LENKVKLFHAFVDEDGNGDISFSEFQDFVGTMTNERLSARLGFSNGEGLLTLESMQELFRSSCKGQQSIDLFCDKIYDVLAAVVSAPSPAQKKKHESTPNSPNNSSCSSVVSALRGRFTHENKFIAVLVLMQIFLFLYWLFYNLITLEKPLPVAFAKGFGLNLRILSVVMFYTMCRSFMGQLYVIGFLHKFIPLGINLELHSFTGFSLLFHSIGHVAAHLGNAYLNLPTGPAYQVAQSSLMNGGWEYRYSGSGDGITGYVLLSLIACMAVTAVMRGLSSTAYWIFYHFHIIGYYLWLVFLYLHVYNLWPWWLAVVVLFVADCIYDLLFKTSISTLAMSRPAPDGVTYISVNIKGAASPEAGSYYRIKVPALSLTEWHPFSFAGNASSTSAKFFVQNLGDWTKALHKCVSDPALRSHTLVIVQGPYRAPAGKIFRKDGKTVLCIASGIGITPFLSVMATNIANAISDENDEDTFTALFSDEESGTFHKNAAETRPSYQDFAMIALPASGQTSPPPPQPQPPRLLGSNTRSDHKDVHIIWSIREISELLFFLDFISQLTKLQTQVLRRSDCVKVDVYMTGLGGSADPSYLVAQTIFLLIAGEKSSSFLRIFYQRPDLDAEIKRIAPSGCYYCGGVAMRDMINVTCSKLKVPFSPESFDSGGSLTNLLAAMKKMTK